MAATWQTVPQVTNHNEVDITDLEKIRQKYKKSIEEEGGKLTFTIILLKALVKTLIKFPHFNASYNSQNQTLVLKKYYHLGLAVDTENGLLVPVLKDVDKKKLLDIALEVGELSQKARDRKLSAAEMQGSCFTVSSLGGLGKIKFFSPIVNWPDVAILGISLEAKYIEGTLILPLSLDHRVIDGAENHILVVEDYKLCGLKLKGNLPNPAHLVPIILCFITKTKKHNYYRAQYKQGYQLFFIIKQTFNSNLRAGTRPASTGFFLNCIINKSRHKTCLYSSLPFGTFSVLFWSPQSL